jgi:hypothetical protein
MFEIVLENKAFIYRKSLKIQVFSKMQFFTFLDQKKKYFLSFLRNEPIFIYKSVLRIEKINRVKPLFKDFFFFFFSF